MELTNEFTVSRPIEETWEIINDLEFIAPCMPGAQLTEINGDEYFGLVKIKVGPITAKYKGKASFISQDAEAKVSKLGAEGRDPRNGRANATITATMTEVTPGGDTLVVIHTDLALVGKIASFGRGAIDDVSKKLLGMFSDNLRDKLAAEGEVGAQAATAQPTATAQSTATAQPTATAQSTATEQPAAAPTNGSTIADESKSTARKIESDEPEAVDLLAVTGDGLVKKLAPVLAGIIGLILLRMILKSRSSD